jgi:hypothetical protein
LRAARHQVFLDRDLEDGLKLGEVWGKRLFEELYQADALVAVGRRDGVVGGAADLSGSGCVHG